MFVLFGSVEAVCVLSGMVSLSSVSPVAAALVVLIVVVASVPVRSPGWEDEKGSKLDLCCTHAVVDIHATAVNWLCLCVCKCKWRHCFSKSSQRYCVVSVRLILLLLSVHTNTSTITDFKPLWWHWHTYLQTHQTWCPRRPFLTFEGDRNCFIWILTMFFCTLFISLTENTSVCSSGCTNCMF